MIAEKFGLTFHGDYVIEKVSRSHFAVFCNGKEIFYSVRLGYIGKK